MYIVVFVISDDQQISTFVPNVHTNLETDNRHLSHDESFEILKKKLRLADHDKFIFCDDLFD